MQENPNQISFREYPVFVLVFGLLSIGSGIYFYFKNGSFAFSAAAIALGLGVILWASTLTVSADRIMRTLTVSRRGIIQRYREEIPFSEIAAIQLGQNYNSEDGTRNYRIEIILKDGNIIPLRKSYSGGRRAKEKKARQLREFIGIGGVDSSFGGMFKAAAQMAKQQLQPQMRAEQESLTGSQDEIHETDGVRWRTETSNLGSLPLLRWISADTTLPQSFLYLAQNFEGQINLPTAKFMQPVNNLLYKQALQLHGFTEDYTPDLDTAQIIELPQSIAPYFTAYTDEPARAQQIINPRMIQALTRWANEHPLSKKNTQDQLTILLGPKGLIMTMPGLMNADFLNEFSKLGAELVRSQGGGR